MHQHTQTHRHWPSVYLSSVCLSVCLSVVCAFFSRNDIVLKWVMAGTYVEVAGAFTDPPWGARLPLFKCPRYQGIHPSTHTPLSAPLSLCCDPCLPCFIGPALECFGCRCKRPCRGCGPASTSSSMSSTACGTATNPCHSKTYVTNTHTCTHGTECPHCPPRQTRDVTDVFVQDNQGNPNNVLIVHPGLLKKRSRRWAEDEHQNNSNNQQQAAGGPTSIHASSSSAAAAAAGGGGGGSVIPPSLPLPPHEHSAPPKV